MATVFLIAFLCLGGTAFLVRFFIALCVDGPKHSCEITHVYRSPNGNVFILPTRAANRTLRFNQNRAVAQVHQMDACFSRAK